VLDRIWRASKIATAADRFCESRGTTVNSGGYQLVEVGGTASDAAITSGADMTIDGGTLELGSGSSAGSG
jgi:autotransporter passenger strand-loop-strand repeat protein